MGQASAALSTTAGQDLTAIGGTHSLAEAVLLGTLTLLGLIGTEHSMTPPLIKILLPESVSGAYSTAKVFTFAAVDNSITPSPRRKACPSL